MSVLLYFPTYFSTPLFFQTDAIGLDEWEIRIVARFQKEGDANDGKRHRPGGIGKRLTQNLLNGAVQVFLADVPVGS